MIMPPKSETRIKRLHEFRVQKDPVLEAARKLDNEFPGAISLLPQSATLYHHSNNLSGLLSSGVFDSAFTEHGAFFFTDAPIPSRTNCTVAIPVPLVLIERNALLKSDISWEEASIKGIDGRFIHDTGEPFAKIAEEQFATEIAIFNGSLPKLGSVSQYRFS